MYDIGAGIWDKQDQLFMKMEHAGKKKKQPTLKQNETGVIR
jgi:hypothetical protein